MIQKSLWRGALVAGLCAVLAIPARADQLSDDARNAVIGIVAVAAAVVVITIVIVHEARKKRTITGCVTARDSGMSVMDEKDKRIYALSGNTANIKQGDRVSLQGKTTKPKDAGAARGWEVSKENKDFGACQPQGHF